MGKDSGPSNAALSASDVRLLDSKHIVTTVETLGRRVRERFPESGLASVNDALLELARQASVRAAAIRRPNWLLRAAAGLFIAGLVVATVVAVGAAGPLRQEVELLELVQVAEAAINDVVLIGAAVFFVVTLETRWKRRRALDAIHEIRSLAHIIDMHQLTKDPVTLLNPGPRTASSPVRSMTPFQLNRYLDYCGEMLALCGKVAALYVQGFQDSVAVGAVNEIETLTSGLSRKVWQKIVLLQEAGG